MYQLFQPSYYANPDFFNFYKDKQTADLKKLLKVNNSYSERDVLIKEIERLQKENKRLKYRKR
jgi:hypothetical protein